MAEKLITLKEAAEILNLEPDQVKKLVKEGRIPCYRIGGEYIRFKQSELEGINLRGAQPVKEMLVPDPYSGLSYRFRDKIRDFWRCNDVYIILILIMAAALYLIFR